LLPLPFDVPELVETIQDTGSAELTDATEESIATRRHLVEAAGELAGISVELDGVEDDAVLIKQAEEMPQPPACDSSELARQAPDHTAVGYQVGERVKEPPLPVVGSAGSLDDVGKQDTSATAQLAQGMEELLRPTGEWEELCDCDGLSDGEDTLASAGFAAENGWRLAHDAVLLMCLDGLEICDDPGFKKVAAALPPVTKLWVALRIASTGWSGMHALLFYMWTFSDHSATKQLLLDVDVAFGSPAGTFMRKIETVCHYWYTLLHMPPHQKTAHDCARQMKEAFREVEKVLLEYDRHHQEYASEHAAVVGGIGASMQAGDTQAEFRRLAMHYAVWAILPELCNVAVNLDHQQMMSDSKTHESNTFLPAFHALGVLCGAPPYLLLACCSNLACGESEAVEAAVNQLFAKCGDSAGAHARNDAHSMDAFSNYVMSMQPVLPGGKGTKERVMKFLHLVPNDEGLVALRTYLMRQQPCSLRLYHGLGARAEEDEPGPVKEPAEKGFHASSLGRPRRSIGGA